MDLGARRADLGALGQDLDVLFALLWVWIWVWASGTLAGVVQLKTAPPLPPTHTPPPAQRADLGAQRADLGALGVDLGALGVDLGALAF